MAGVFKRPISYICSLHDSRRLHPRKHQFMQSIYQYKTRYTNAHISTQYLSYNACRWILFCYFTPLHFFTAYSLRNRYYCSSYDLFCKLTTFRDIYQPLLCQLNTKLWLASQKCRDHSEDQDVDGKIILNWIWGKKGLGVWIGCLWLRKETDSRFLWTR